MGFTLALFTHMDFDQNQKIGHFGKVTPPQCGRIPEIPIAVCFGAENPLIFRRKIASKSRNFPNFPENDPCLRVWVHILRKFKSLKFCPFFRIYPTTSRDWPGNATKRGFRGPPQLTFSRNVFPYPKSIFPPFFPIISATTAHRSGFSWDLQFPSMATAIAQSKFVKFKRKKRKRNNQKTNAIMHAHL